MPRPYTNVTFDPHERRVFERASVHLRVAFPDMGMSVPTKRSERVPDDDARVIHHLARDTAAGTHENVHQALRVMTKLVDELTRGTELAHWLAVMAEAAGHPITHSDEPTSQYQQAVRMAEARVSQLRDANEALELLHETAPLVTAREDTKFADL